MAAGGEGPAPQERARHRPETQRRQRFVRLCALVINPLLAFLFFQVPGHLHNTTVTFEFDPLSVLVVDVAGCAVDVSTCTQGSDCGIGTVHVTSNAMHSSMSKVYRIGTSVLEYLTVESTVNCLELFDLCESVCSIQIVVPEHNSLDLKINQVKSRQEGIAKLLVNNVKLKSLFVSGFSIVTELINANLQGLSKIKSGSELIRVVDSDLANAHLEAAEGNVRVVYTKDSPVEFVELHARATTHDDKACISAPNSWEEPATETLARCMEGRYLGRLQSTFDADGNGKVTATDFTEGTLDLHKCCGGDCPVRNLCEKTLTPTYLDYGESYIKLDTLYERVAAQGDYTVVPWCTRKALLAVDRTLNLTDSTAVETSGLRRNKLTIMTNMGGVQVLMIDRDPSSATPTVPADDSLADDADAADAGTATSRLVMTESSGLAIMQDIRDVYGEGPLAAGEDEEAVPNIFAVFTVDWDPYMDGWDKPMSSRFVYTNSPVLVTVPPSVLRALSVGLMGPEVKHYRVKLVAPGCAAPEAALREEEIGKELFRVLIPRFRTSLYGLLVQMHGGSTLERPKISRYVLDPATRETISAEYEPDLAGYFSLFGSLAIGFLVASGVMSKLSTIIRLSVVRAVRKDDARTLALKQGTAKHSMENHLLMSRSVLESPVEIFEILLVEPLRRAWTDSLGLFLDRTYTKSKSKSKSSGEAQSAPLRDVVKRTIAIVKPSSVAPMAPQRAEADTAAQSLTTALEKPFFVQPEDSPGEEHAMGAPTLADFMRRYEAFCFRKDLDMIDDRDQVINLLLRSHGVRVRRVLADRVFGWSWRHDGVSVLEPLPASEHVAPSYDYAHEVESKGLRAMFKAVKKSRKDGKKTPEPIAALAIFADTFLVSGVDRTKFLPVEDVRTGKGKGSAPGLMSAFHKFYAVISSHRGPLPTLSNEDFAQVGIERKQVRVELLPGLELLNREEQAPRYAPSWYALQYVLANVHQAAFAVGPILVLRVVLEIQYKHAEIVGSRTSLHRNDVQSLGVRQNIRDFDVLTTVQVMASLTFATIAISWLLLLFVYTGASTAFPRLDFVVRKIFRLVFGFSLFTLITLGVTQCVWVLLAAFLYPSRFLPFGASVSCFFSVLTVQYARIASIRAKIDSAFGKVFNELMRRKVAEIIELRQKLPGQLTSSMQSIDPSTYEFNPADLFDLIDLEGKRTKTARPTAAAALAAHGEDEEAPGSPGEQEAFADMQVEQVLGGAQERPGAAGDGTLTREEFDNMFNMLDINVLPSRRDLLFSFCDNQVDNEMDGVITREEFLDAWDFLEDEIRRSVVTGGLGLSPGQIALYLGLLGLTLLLLFAFLLGSVSIFRPGGSFSSTVQTVIIAGFSTASASLSSVVGAAASAEALMSKSPEQLETTVNCELEGRLEPQAASA